MMSSIIAHPTAVVISDLHVGDPQNPKLDDFTRDSDFAHLLAQVIPTRAKGPATLIINGDFIDFPQVLPELGQHKLGAPFGVTEEQSVAKLERVIRGHPLVFDSLVGYLDRGGQVVIIPGNHDIDLHWPAVFELLRERLSGAAPPELVFVGNGEVDERRVHIEHGNQYSFDNRFENWTDPFLTAPDGSRRIERPWGTLFMDLVYNGIEEAYPFVHQVHPARRMAWIALRSFGNSEHVSVKVLAQLIAFFILHGKRSALEHLLGEEEQVSEEGIEQLLRRLGIARPPEQQEAIAREVISLVAPQHNQSKHLENSPLPWLLGEGEGEDMDWLLGRNDKWGMRKRRQELFRSGEVDVVVFGHTHVPVDGNASPWASADSPRREFNTGSWMPRIPLADGESPAWKDLKSRTKAHDIYYLALDLSDTPKGWLEPLTASLD